MDNKDKIFFKLTLKDDPMIKWAKDMGRHSTAENIWMANKHMEESPTKINLQ